MFPHRGVSSRRSPAVVALCLCGVSRCCSFGRSPSARAHCISAGPSFLPVTSLPPSLLLSVPPPRSPRGGSALKTGQLSCVAEITLVFLRSHFNCIRNIYVEEGQFWAACPLGGMGSPCRPRGLDLGKVSRMECPPPLHARTRSRAPAKLQSPCQSGDVHSVGRRLATLRHGPLSSSLFELSG